MSHQAVALGEAFAARVAHRFHSITEELSVLVFFAPAEGSNGGTC